MAGKQGNGEKKLRKVDGINDGRVWLNVLESNDGTQELFTINRSFKTEQGWRSTPFFHKSAGDIESIKRVLEQYEQRQDGDAAQAEEVPI